MSETLEEGPDGGKPAAIDDDTKRRLVVRIEEVVFSILLALLSVAGLLPIAGRIFEFSELTWTSGLSHHLVLWIALLGAGAATRDRKHISIDAIGHALPRRVRLGLRALTELFSALVCGLLVDVAWSFSSDEREFAGDATAFFGIPEGWLPTAIPIGLALLSMRFFVAAGMDARAAFISEDDTSTVSSNGQRGSTP